MFEQKCNLSPDISGTPTKVPQSLLLVLLPKDRWDNTHGEANGYIFAEFHPEYTKKAQRIIKNPVGMNSC
jgi:hypothetical protein